MLHGAQQGFPCPPESYGAPLSTQVLLSQSTPSPCHQSQEILELGVLSPANPRKLVPPPMEPGDPDTRRLEAPDCPPPPQQNWETGGTISEPGDPMLPCQNREPFSAVRNPGISPWVWSSSSSCGGEGKAHWASGPLDVVGGEGVLQENRGGADRKGPVDIGSISSLLRGGSMELLLLGNWKMQS